jgi:anti-sigma factor RsiW
MSCKGVQNSISAFLDRRVGEEQRTRVVEHLASCRECANYYDDVARVRENLHSLPQARVPARLRMQLLVLASRERVRWNATKTLPLALRTWMIDLRLSVDNLMRPLAVPVAGGLASALLLFSMLMPTLGFRHNVRNDVPIRLYTAATLVEAAPMAVSNDETVVELYVDANGKAMDYSVQRGRISPEMQADLTKMMYSSVFVPATWFGQPTIGTVLVTFRSLHYVVRG